MDTIVDVDLRTVDGRPDPIRMSALLKALSRNIATEASLEKLATEAVIPSGNLSTPTVRNYLDQLTRTRRIISWPARCVVSQEKLGEGRGHPSAFVFGFVKRAG